jgi:hypothetical protein
VFIKDSPCQFIEKSFFEIKRDDKTKFKCYPVQVFALPVEWIIQDEDDAGINFLNKLLDQEDYDIFEIPTVIMLVEYLYRLS